jgi:hypothetical protein
MSSLDIVCPYIPSDKERFEILWESLEKFCKVKNYRLFLVSLSGDNPVLSSKIIPIKEKDLDIHLVDPIFTKKYGWWKQQIIKLLSFKFCETETILVVDCDSFLNKNLFVNSYTFKNKIKIALGDEGSFSNWYAGSKSVLKIPFNSQQHKRVGVTPFLFSRSILKSLDKYLTVLYGNNKTEYLLSNTNDMFFPSKLFNDPSETWTEYTLYHIYAQYTGLINKYHYIDNTFKLGGNSYWHPEECENWDPSMSFNDPEHFFTVCQSSAKKPASWVREKIATYLQ